MNVSKLNIGPTAQFGQQNLLQEHRAQKQKRALRGARRTPPP